MLKTITQLVLSSLIAVGGIAPAAAQDDTGPDFAAVDLYTCKYKDRQGPRDLDDAVKKMNDWMDKSDASAYTAWSFTPHYVTDQQDFDFLWIGASPDYATMGVSNDRYLESGGDVAEAFAKVADCAVHINVASLNVKPLPEGPPDQTPVISIANCTVADGRRMDDVVAANVKWGVARANNGSTAGTWMWFPVFGGGDVGFDFTIVNGYAGHTELGQEMNAYFASQSWKAARQTFAGLVSCDVARVYNGMLRRSPAED